MRYINALELIELCVDNSILQEENGKVFVYRDGTPQSEPGWYLDEKDIVAKELMNDEEGQKILISALNEKNIEFVLTDYL